MASTSARTLRLLSLLQTHRFWPGPELAGRLEVSERTLRRDVDRLRELGYPVRSSRGLEGGYQLGSGGSLPPLVVDEEEAIAMVVALGQTASLTSGSLGDATLSALSKVVQVLPPRLRRRAEALRAASAQVTFREAPEVEASTLGALAQAIRDAERIRFGYTARGGEAPGERRGRHVEPHHLVTVGRRWYLLAFDVERADWRSFRLDRMGEVAGTKGHFRPREVPGGDPVDYVRSRMSRRETAGSTVVTVAGEVEAVAKEIGRWASVSDAGDGRCRVEVSQSPMWTMLTLGAMERDFVVESAPSEVREALARWGQRFGEASASWSGAEDRDLS